MEEGIDYSNVRFVPYSVGDVPCAKRIQAGDVLITRKGSFGVSTIAIQTDEESIVSSEIRRIALVKDVNPNCFSAFNNSRLGRAQCQRNAVGAIMPGINHTTLRRFRIPVPPHEIQHTIAGKMSAAYKRKRELETKAAELLASIDSLVLDQLGIRLPELSDQSHFVQSAHAVRGGS